MKKVLVIAYYFPPIGMGGVPRIVNFCRYLPKFGFEPIVLTVKDIEYFAYDYDLLHNIEYKIIRTESLDPLRLMKIFNRKRFVSTRKKGQKISNLLIPDNKIGWLPFSVSAGLRINADIIFATAPPWTSIIIGGIIKRIKKIPLVIDLRDPWPMRKNKIDKWLKNTFLNDADAIVATNSAIKNTIYNKKNTFIIPHGYNPEDFDNNFFSKKFIISYVGTITEERNPYYFLKAIAELIKEEKIKKENIEINFVGFHTDREEELIKELNLSCVHLHSYIPHHKCINYIMNSNILLIIIPENEKISSPGKIGEYIGARKPILGLMPNDNPCASLIKQYNLGVVVSINNTNAIKSAIYDYYLKFKNCKLEKLPQRSEFTWFNLTKQLSNIFQLTEK